MSVGKCWTDLRRASHQRYGCASDLQGQMRDNLEQAFWCDDFTPSSLSNPECSFPSGGMCQFVNTLKDGKFETIKWFA
jgi:hypothetical protein